MVQGLASHPRKFRLRAKSKEESRKNFKAKVRGVEVCISESDFWLRHGSIKTGAGETSQETAASRDPSQASRLENGDSQLPKLFRRLNLRHLATDGAGDVEEKDESRTTRSPAWGRRGRPSTEQLLLGSKFLKAATLFGKETCQSLGQPHKKIPLC